MSLRCDCLHAPEAVDWRSGDREQGTGLKHSLERSPNGGLDSTENNNILPTTSSIHVPPTLRPFCLPRIFPQS